MIVFFWFLKTKFNYFLSSRHGHFAHAFFAVILAYILAYKIRLAYIWPIIYHKIKHEKRRKITIKDIKTYKNINFNNPTVPTIGNKPFI